MKHVSKIVYGSLVLLLVAGTVDCFAQQGGGGGGRRGGGGQSFDPEQMRQMVMQRFQEQLKATDDEWKVIQPLIEKVWDLQRETRVGGMGGFGRGFFRPGGPNGQGGPGGQGGQGQAGDQQNRPRRQGFGGEESPEMQALQQALESDSTPAAEIQAKLTALRDARKKKEAELQKSQDDLKKVLTVRQEAISVLMGLFE